MKKVFIILAVVALVACTDKKNNQTKAPIQVKTEVVTHAENSADGQTYVGMVEEQEATAVSFTGMGVVRRVLVSEGQAVGKGQLLAEMDNTQALNLLRGAEAAMTQANDALERYSLLHDAGSLPEVQWVEIQSKVAQAKSQLEVAKKNLADCRLVAPVSGIIGKRHITAGETAMPSQAVVTIFDISNVKVKVSIPETEINAISTNTPSVIEVEAAGSSFAGGQIEKGVQADALTHTYDISIKVANRDHKLLPGMVASVQFAALPTQQTGLTVPVTAVQRRADGSLFIWTIENDSTAQGIAHRTAVTIGETKGNRIAISTGLTDGQRIITEGYQKLSEGTKVVY